jgi:hypothetical protein
MARKGNGDGQGPGWGGPAKGASKKKDRPLLKTAGPGRGHVNEDRAARNERWREEMFGLYYGLASNAEKPDMTRIQAATHLLNRLDGLPVAKPDAAGTEVKITIEGGLPRE